MGLGGRESVPHGWLQLFLSGCAVSRLQPDQLPTEEHSGRPFGPHCSSWGRTDSGGCPWPPTPNCLLTLASSDQLLILFSLESLQIIGNTRPIITHQFSLGPWDGASQISSLPPDPSCFSAGTGTLPRTQDGHPTSLVESQFSERGQLEYFQFIASSFILPPSANHFFMTFT